MKEQFEHIYASNEWGNGSGAGSMHIHNKSYMNFVESFIAEHDVKSVLDFGCGDWQFSQYIDWGDASYVGLDIVGSVVSNNVKNFETENITFQVYSGDVNSLPKADLLIVKDVFQHWSALSIARFFPAVSHYRYALITNCVGFNELDSNSDIDDGGFRYLDLTKPPFNLKAKKVFSFSESLTPEQKSAGMTPSWNKQTLLVEINA